MMRVVFFSDLPCAMSANGLYLGAIDSFERSVRLDPADGVFLECRPSGRCPVQFRFDENFLFAPPPEVDLCFTGESVIVRLSRFRRTDGALRVLRQARIDGTAYTLYVQGRVLLSFENETGMHTVELPDSLENAALSAAGGGILVEGASDFCLVGRAGEILVQKPGKVVGRGEILRAEVPLGDSRGHVAVCGWKDGTLTECTLRAACAPTEATFALALFESALIGADPRPFLSPALAEKADALREYLGDFLAAVLTPDPAAIGLVYRVRERVYETRYFRVTIEDGKVANISPAA